MLLILSILISAIAALVGVFSKSWNREKQGIRKLSFSGWLSLGLALSGCTVSTIIAIKTENLKRSSEIEKQRIKALAYERLANASFDLLTPIREILIQDTIFTALAIFDSLPSQVAKELNSEEALRFLRDHPFKSVDVRRMPLKKDREQNGFDYNMLIESYSDDVEKLKRVQNEWSFYLETDDLLLIDSIVHHTFYARIRDMEPPENDLRNFPFSSHSLLIHYKDYVDKITRLLVKVEPKKKLLKEYFPQISEIFSDLNYDKRKIQ